MGIQDLQPIFFRMLKETIAVNVVHEHDAHHRGQIREAPIALDPLWTPAPSAVRGKHVLISGVQLSVDGFEDTFVTAQVGIRESGATRHGVINQKAEVQLRTSALFYVERKAFTGQQ